jgi:transposase
LHRAVDLGFPEFTRYVRTLESQLATTILSRYPTAASFQGVSMKKLARIIYDGSHKVGEELARPLIEAAKRSVGSHHSEAYRLRIQYLCEDLDVLRHRLKDLARDIERKIDDHEVGKLLTTIDGVGPLTAARLIAELGDPACFRSAGAIASYVGVAPRLRQSGKKRFSGSPTIPFGNARLRKTLWMVVLNAVRCNPWLRQYYDRLRAAGKPGKVAVIAAHAQTARCRLERGHASPTVRSACGSDASRRSRPGSMTNQVVMRTALGPRNMIVSRHSMVC